MHPTKIANTNKLLKLLKTRLQSSGKNKSQDGYGNVVYIDFDIYGDDTLESFICLSLSEFNQTPHFTGFTLEDSHFIDLFADILVEGAVLYALSSKALIEKGREFKIEDHGVTMDPPSISEMLLTQYSMLLQHHWEKLKIIKEHIKSYTKG